LPDAGTDATLSRADDGVGDAAFPAIYLEETAIASIFAGSLRSPLIPGIFEDAVKASWYIRSGSARRLEPNS
jgi:hypothetical protein